MAPGRYHMTIMRMVQEKDCVRCYGVDEHYYVIVPAEEAARLTVGQVIIYDPYGMNYGWFVREAPDRKDAHG